MGTVLGDGEAVRLYSFWTLVLRDVGAAFLLPRPLTVFCNSVASYEKGSDPPPKLVPPITGDNRPSSTPPRSSGCV